MEPYMKQMATLNIDGKSIELPVLEAASGADVIDVRSLSGAGIFTYDPGFLSTASCDSKITYIDGDAGILMHRGYPIEQLAGQSEHLEVCYLLLHGELPKENQLAAFKDDINKRMPVDDEFAKLFDGFNSSAHPMSMLCAAVAGLAAQFHDGLDIYNEDHRTESALQLIAKMPTLAAMTYRKITDQPFVAPNPELDYAENFLNMCFGDPGQTSKISSTMASAMDKIFILHADHEQNASTSTVRLAGSTEANPYAAIAAGIAALWGPSHGGANEAVLTMLEQIGDISEVAKYVDKAKDKGDSFKLMGFGHRVYKNFDPRALVMQDSCHAVLAEKNIEDEPLLKIATRLEKIAREEPYFIERKLYPNIDFYSGITLKAMAIPTSMYTVVFALGRTPGWISHWCEMLSEPFKIGRPRQLYLGSQQRNYTEISSR